jgi:hypothetical protein
VSGDGMTSEALDELAAVALRAAYLHRNRGRGDSPYARMLPYILGRLRETMDRVQAQIEVEAAIARHRRGL